MELESAYALLESGAIGPESLPQLAIEALRSGLDSTSLRLLAGMAPFDPRDARELFVQAMKELAIPRPDSHKAVVVTGRFLANEALEGSIDLRVACAKIWSLFLGWLAENFGTSVPPDVQQLANAGQFAEFWDIPEGELALDPAQREQMEREAFLEIRRLAAGTEATDAERPPGAKG